MNFLDSFFVFTVFNEINEFVLSLWGSFATPYYVLLGSVIHGLAKDCLERVAELAMSQENFIFSLVIELFLSLLLGYLLVAQGSCRSARVLDGIP